MGMGKAGAKESIFIKNYHFNLLWKKILAKEDVSHYNMPTTDITMRQRLEVILLPAAPPEGFVPWGFFLCFGRMLENVGP